MVAQLKFEEEIKLSEARTHMVAYVKLLKFRKSKFKKKSNIYFGSETNNAHQLY